MISAKLTNLVQDELKNSPIMRADIPWVNIPWVNIPWVNIPWVNIPWSNAACLRADSLNDCKNVAADCQRPAMERQPLSAYKYVPS